MDQDIIIETMSIEDKLKMMERLWNDLCQNANNISSPDWHRDVLMVREKSLSEGDEKIVTLKEAKKLIANSTQ